jgi:hypothetical protein
MTQTEVLQMVLKKLEHLWDIGIDAEYKVELLPEINAIKTVLNGKTQLHWAGLTDEELDDCYDNVEWNTVDWCPDHQQLARAVEAKLKEKNT